MAMRPVPASDIYALGVTCIYLLTGKSPKDLDYDPSTGELLWERHVAHISPHFKDVLKKMLEIAVKQRFHKAEDVFRQLDLEAHLDSLANSVTRMSGKPPSPSRRFGEYRSDMDSMGSPSSPHARAAAAIRARQIKTDTLGLPSGTLRSRVSDPRTGGLTSLKTGDSAGKSKGFTGEKSKPPTRLDADGVQSYYMKGKRDFADHDLHALSLSRTNLSGANFHQSNLSKIDLQGANLGKANFGRANLSHAKLKEAILTDAYLSYADLEGADLRGADLSRAYLLNANLRGANLCGANLSGAKLSEEQLAMARTNWMTVRPNGKRW
jgi:serine/threonine-protein kinase